MPTLYHATGPTYQPGEPLLSLQAQIERGWVTEEEAAAIISRWEASDTYLLEDGAMVSLTESREEAEWVLEEFNGGEGVILAVDGDALAEENLLRRNAEGYPAVYSAVPASFIQGPVA